MGILENRYEMEHPHRQDERRGTSENGPPQSKVDIVACWVALIATIACNGLFESLRLGGVTSAEVSNEVFAWFAPAGYVFSIWGVIYAALVVWLFVATSRSRKRRTIGKHEATLFMVSCVLNISWLVLFHLKVIALSLAVIVALWGVVAALYTRFNRQGAPLWTRIPFSLYLGWLTVAVFANAAHWVARMVALPLVVNQVSTVAIAVFLLGVAYFMMRKYNDWVFPLVVLWAAVGVGVRLASVDTLVSTMLFALSAVAALVIYIPKAITSMRKKGERQGA